MFPNRHLRAPGMATRSDPKQEAKTTSSKEKTGAINPARQKRRNKQKKITLTIRRKDPSPKVCSVSDEREAADSAFYNIPKGGVASRGLFPSRLAPKPQRKSERATGLVALQKPPRGGGEVSQAGEVFFFNRGKKKK